MSSSDDDDPRSLFDKIKAIVVEELDSCLHCKLIKIFGFEIEVHSLNRGVDRRDAASWKLGELAGGVAEVIYRSSIVGGEYQILDSFMDQVNEHLTTIIEHDLGGKRNFQSEGQKKETREATHPLHKTMQ